MTDMTEAAFKEWFHAMATTQEEVPSLQDAWNAAIEAARPYIIAEYNERLMSDSAVEAAIIGDAKCGGTLFESQQAAIKAAIQKAGQV
jgi:hypothetical protein